MKSAHDDLPDVVLMANTLKGNLQEECLIDLTESEVLDVFTKKKVADSSVDGQVYHILSPTA